MKNSKFGMRIATFLMAVIMLFVTSITAFADEEVNASKTNSGAVTRDAQYSDQVPAGTSKYIDVYMSSYLGFVKTFSVSSSAIQSPASGTVYIKLTKNNTTYGEWTINHTGGTQQDYTLPPSGWYKVLVINNSNVLINVTCQWI